MTRRPRAHVVAFATLALFLTVFALLVFQLRSGRDPALGATAAAQTRTPAPKKQRILIRKVIITRRVVHLPAETAAPAPTTRVSAAVPAASGPAPAPAPVPAPAPAPAPLTTQSS